MSQEGGAGMASNQSTYRYTGHRERRAIVPVESTQPNLKTSAQTATKTTHFMVLNVVVCITAH